MTHVIKNNGKEEAFSDEKVINSIKHAGIPHAMQQQVLEHIKQKLFEGITTSEIHNHIREYLHTSTQPSLVVKYDLKQAIMSLGPTGYPFEDYVAKLLQFQGYETQTRTVLRGKCVSHEIDVIALQQVQGKPKKTMIEAKFHNGLGTVTDVHVSMYTQARFQDLREQHHFDNCMLITNTKVTSDAIAYGECMGMEVIGWNYPEKNALRDWIENMSLYPVTALTALTNSQKAQLLQNDVVLCQDICKNHKVLDKLELTDAQKKEIIDEASFACSR